VSAEARVRRAGRWMRAIGHELSGRGACTRGRLDGRSAAILMYHRVLAGDPPAGPVEPGMLVRRSTFTRHLDWLQEEFRVLPLSEIVERLGGDRPLPPRACAITFDDGWRDNHQHALPELERRALPATVFVVTGRVGTDGAFWPDEVYRSMTAAPLEVRAEVLGALGVRGGRDPLHALLDHLKALRPELRDEALEALRRLTESPATAGAPAADPREILDWDEVERLAAGGVAIESHGVSHAILTDLPDEDVLHELRNSRETLRERGHGRGAVFAYPSSAFDGRVRRLAGEAGYRAALTTVHRIASLGDDPLALPRLGVHDDVTRTRAEFRYRLAGTA
jgi:peptidoglycan/xylan/chitin deacetylase (PgdA/CDA1 family)